MSKKGKATNLDVQIGKNLRHIREKYNISYKQICEALKITTQQLYKYEQGTNRLSGGSIAKLVNSFDIKLDEFFYETDEKTFFNKINKKYMHYLTCEAIIPKLYDDFGVFSRYLFALLAIQKNIPKALQSQYNALIREDIPQFQSSDIHIIIKLAKNCANEDIKMYFLQLHELIYTSTEIMELVHKATEQEKLEKIKKLEN